MAQFVFNGDDGKAQGGARNSYFEGIFECIITDMKVQKRINSQWADVQTASPYDHEARLYLELTVGNAQYPNRYTIPGGPCFVDANGKKRQHPWASVMTTAGLSERADSSQLIGRPVKAVFFATAPNTAGQVYTNVWLLFRATDNDEYIQSVALKSIESGKGLGKKAHPMSYWRTGQPLEKVTEVEVEVETSGDGVDDGDDLPF